MRGWRRHMRGGKTTATTGKATAAATMGSGKAAAPATPTPTMVLRARAGRNAGGSKKNKDERDRTHPIRPPRRPVPKRLTEGRVSRPAQRLYANCGLHQLG